MIAVALEIEVFEFIPKLLFSIPLTVQMIEVFCTKELCKIGYCNIVNLINGILKLGTTAQNRL